MLQFYYRICLRQMWLCRVTKPRHLTLALRGVWGQGWRCTLLLSFQGQGQPPHACLLLFARYSHPGWALRPDLHFSAGPASLTHNGVPTSREVITNNWRYSSTSEKRGRAGHQSVHKKPRVWEDESASRTEQASSS